MKFLSLDLLAYGPFTNMSLDFASSGKNLHIIYGLNEAGKSSALRAITALLYGIPPRTADNFLHDNDMLRIGAQLQRSDGQERYFIRRKGNKNTLLDEGGTAVPDHLISEFLDGIPLEVFEKMYGIGAESLVEGGRELVEGKGDLGAALFSAVSGIAEVREVLAGIERRKEELFKAKGSNPVINSLSTRYEELKKKRKESILPVNVWKDIEDRIRETAEKLQEVSRQTNEKQASLNHKKRIMDAYKDVRELREITEELEGMKDAPRLSEDFTRRRERAEEKLNEARENLSEDTESLKSVQDELKSINVPSKIIDQASRITKTHQLSGNYKQANEQLPRLQGDILALKGRARQLLRELDLPDSGDDFSRYCITIQTKTRINTLSDEHKTLVSDLEHLKNAHAQTITTLKNLKDKLGDLPKPTNLGGIEVLLDEYRQGDINEKVIKKLGAEVRQLEDLLEEHKRHLGLSDLTNESLAALTAPGKNTISRFGKDFQALNQQREDIERRLKAETKAHTKIQKDIEAIRKQGNVPTEEDLKETRGNRDALWGMVRASWEENKDIPEKEWKPFNADAETPADAFEYTVTNADSVSDLLRIESERVAQLITLTNSLRESEEGLEDLEKEHIALEVKTSELEQLWSSSWAEVIRLRSPDEMREWIDLHKEALDTFRELKKKKEELKTATEEISRIKVQFTGLIESFGFKMTDSTLDGLVRKAEELIRQENDKRILRSQVEERISESEAEAAEQKEKVKETASQLDEWKKNWEKALSGAHLNSDITPEQAKPILEKFSDLAAVVHDIEGKSSRTRAIESDNKRFEDDVDALLKLVSRDKPDAGYVVAVEQLNTELAEGRENITRQNALEKRAKELNKTIKRHEETIIGKEAEIKELLREAKVSDPKQLPEKEALSAKLIKKTARSEDLRQIISRSAAGMALEAFLVDVEATDIDTLPQEVADLERQIEELDRQRSSLDEERGSLYKEKDSLSGGSKAAQITEEMESILADLREATEEYVQLTLASSRMKEEFEKYRQKNQGPLLTRAGQLMKIITMDRITGLAADYDDNDNPVLVGLRNGSRIRVDGMSDGTCDQLYLALRLASLEQRMEQREPMPLILDDILVNFDDARANQTLRVLAEMSKKTGYNQKLWMRRNKRTFRLK